jgi:type III pantothenate kinase
MRLLVISIGNTNIRAGLFSGDQLIAKFQVPIVERVERHALTSAATSERTRAHSERSRPRKRVAVDLRATAKALRRRLNAHFPKKVDAAGLCSVVPTLTPAVAAVIASLFRLHPRLLTAVANHGLKIGYRRPRELGTDRLASALGAAKRFPGQNILVVDCGTATTITALSRKGALLGGAILPGLALWPAMLASRTAQLPRITPGRPRRALGRSTREGLRSGIWFGHVGAVRELIEKIGREAFGKSKVLIIGTGGNAPSLGPAVLFDVLEPDLILYGLKHFASAP